MLQAIKSFSLLLLALSLLLLAYVQWQGVKAQRSMAVAQVIGVFDNSLLRIGMNELLQEGYSLEEVFDHFYSSPIVKNPIR